MGKREVVTSAVSIVMIVLLSPLASMAGNLEPSAPPGPTMRTLDELQPTWSQVLPEAERFVLVMNDEAVLDRETGIVWQRELRKAGVQPVLTSWSQVELVCAAHQVGGRKGWRAPDIVELFSLRDENDNIPLSIFNEVAGTGYFWSSSESMADPTYGYVYLIDSSGHASYNVLTKNTPAHVLCVRTPFK